MGETYKHLHAAGISCFYERPRIKTNTPESNSIYFSVQSENIPCIYFEMNICEATYCKCTVEEILDMNSLDDCCQKWNLFASVFRFVSVFNVSVGKQALFKDEYTICSKTFLCSSAQTTN